MNTVKSVSPEDASALISSGARLVDIREAEERDQVIPEAYHLPLSGIGPDIMPLSEQQAVIFHCRTGRRTAMNAQKLSAATSAAQVYLLDGGFDAWAGAGLPVQNK
ncbi:rhodanese-like domain-containing protein [Asticcacaulis tiandongensis]|uniref:rhodanese-like domain-containing protein n=1 Tax=Asticcacaulis tiandongensis TaxID=2565365 RepID=UPI00112E32B2|nr:rhodanese-like domain-containing protein [Asticcacaulis tiandongensis]